MKRILFISPGALALVAGLLLIALLASLPARQSESVSQQPAAVLASSLAAQQTSDLEGAFSGLVTLDWALPGAYTDALPTPASSDAAPQLGQIDLGLLLRQVDTQVTGFVDLGATLVFTREHTIEATPVGYEPGPGVPTVLPSPLAVGPAVTGVFDGDTLTLESERFAFVTETGLSLLRQFRLVGAPVAGSGNQFRGEYRETFWGFGQQPLTLVGRFQLVQPVAATPSPPPIDNNKLYLPLLGVG